MARIRSNFVGGVIGGDLTAIATAFTATRLNLLPTIPAVTATPNADYAAITLDPNAIFGEPEIVHVTAHTIGQSTATILRGQEGTTARQHLSVNSVTWIHAPTKQDWDSKTDVVTDVLANRPTPEVAGRTFYATDTKQWFRDDGAAWHEIIMAEHAAINDPAVWIDIRSRGALSDGSDSRIAIQAALDAGVAFIPAAIYDVAAALKIHTGSGLVGSGWASVLRLRSGVSTNTHLIENQHVTLGGGGDSGMFISRVKLDGNRAANGATTGLSGMTLSYISHSTIRDVWLSGFTLHCIDFTGATASTGGDNVGNLVEGCRMDDYGTGTAGFACDFVGGGFYNRIAYCRAFNTRATSAFAIDDQSGSQASQPGEWNVIHGCHAEGMGYGYLIEGSHYNSVGRSTARNCTVAGFALSEGADTTSPVGNDFSGHNKAFNCPIGFTVIGDNACENNDVYMPGTGTPVGILVPDVSVAISPSPFPRLSRNRIYGQNTGTGIHVTQGIAVELGPNTVSNVDVGYIIDSTNRALTQVSVDGGRIKNCRLQGMKIVVGGAAVSDIRLRDTFFVNISTSSSGTYAGVEISGGTPDRLDADGLTLLDDQGSPTARCLIDPGSATHTSFGNRNRVWRATCPVVANINYGTLRTCLTTYPTLDFGSISPQASAVLTTTVSGARAGDAVIVTPDVAIANVGEVNFLAYVSTNDTVAIQAINSAAGARDPASGGFRIVVFQMQPPGG